MKPNPIARRLLEGGALFLIGDGIMGLLKPRRHSLLWDCGPQPIRSVTEGLADNPELAGWIAKTGHTSRFMLLGERRDVPACLSAMDVFCLSSRTEGFPNVVGEAMAMSLPCVVTDVGDAAMLVANTGVVVAKEDANALAAGLSRLVEMTPEARRHLGQMAKARIHAEFTMARARERFEDLYQRLVEER